MSSDTRSLSMAQLEPNFNESKNGVTMPNFKLGIDLADLTPYMICSLNRIVQPLCWDVSDLMRVKHWTWNINQALEALEMNSHASARGVITVYYCSLPAIPKRPECSPTIEADLTPPTEGKVREAAAAVEKALWKLYITRKWKLSMVFLYDDGKNQPTSGFYVSFLSGFSMWPLAKEYVRTKYSLPQEGVRFTGLFATQLALPSNPALLPRPILRVDELRLQDVITESVENLRWTHRVGEIDDVVFSVYTKIVEKLAWNADFMLILVPLGPLLRLRDISLPLYEKLISLFRELSQRYPMFFFTYSRIIEEDQLVEQIKGFLIECIDMQ